MNKGLKFGFIFAGIYIILFALLLGIGYFSNSIGLLALSYLFLIPFGLIWNSNLAYILNAVLYFLVGFGIGLLIEKLKK